MTVKELIDELQKHDPQTLVVMRMSEHDVVYGRLSAPVYYVKASTARLAVVLCSEDS